MATPVFVAGYDKAVTFQLDGQGASTTLNITEWDWGEMVKELITTHSGSGGVEAMIAGILRGEGGVTANFDSANIVHGGTNAVRAGAKGTIQCQSGTTNPFGIHVMVVRINWKSVVDGLVTYNFSIKLDSSSGSYTVAS